MGESARAIIERAIERSKCRDCTWARPCAQHITEAERKATR